MIDTTSLEDLDSLRNDFIASICEHNAFESGYDSFVQYLAIFKDEPLPEQINYVQLLATATEFGDYEVCKYIVEATNIDINKYNYVVNRTAESGSLKLLKYYISVGFDINIDSGTILSWSACEGRLEMVKFLVESGISESSYKPAFLWAVSEGETAIKEYLLSKSKNPKEFLNEAERAFGDYYQ